MKNIASVGLSVTTTVWLSGAAMIVPVAHAQTTAELQAQIAALLAQIQALQAQLASQQGGTSGGGASYNFTRDLTVGSRGDDVAALQQWLVSKGYMTWPTGVAYGYFGSLTKAAVAKWQQAAGITPAAGYFGPKSRAAIAAAGGTGGGTGGGGVPIPPSGISATLAFDNPSSANVPKGALSVPYLKFTLAGNGTVTSLTFKRTGLGATTDFVSGGIYLYEGNTRLTTGRTLNSTTHEVTFAGLNIVLANNSRTFWLGADMATGATTGSRNAFSLISSIPEVSGMVQGNEMTVAGVQVGSAKLSRGVQPADPKVGEVDALLSEFRIEAGTAEDISLRRVVLTQGGSIANSNLSNFILKQGGNTLATASGVSGRDLVVFDLATPFDMEKGQTRTFEVYGTIGASARVNDQIKLYVDSSADVYAVGKRYGYGVGITQAASPNAFDSSVTALAVQGGPVTITFNGPAASDIPARAQDFTAFDFTIATQNNIEIRKMVFLATTTGLSGDNAFNDVKVWDATANTVLTSSADVTGSGDITFTDPINMSAGTSKRFKVTLDSHSSNDSGDSITLSLKAFGPSDIRNLDNNTFVSTSDIVPSSIIVGNKMTVKTVGLEVSLAGSPASRTVAPGSSNVDTVGFVFRATTGNIRLNSIKITAAAASGTASGLRADLQSTALYVDGVRISDVKNFTDAGSGSSTAVFSNLNYTIQSGQQKTVVVRVGQIASNAVNTAEYYTYIANLATDVSAVDSLGNTVNAGTGAINLPVTRKITIGTPSIQVSKVDNSATEAGLVVANGERLLGQFEFYASNADVTVKKLKVGVSPTATSTATTSLLANEVQQIRLYVGGSMVASGVPDASGANAGRVKFDVTNGIFTVPSNDTKVVEVRAVLADINSSTGAGTGKSIYAYLHNDDFEAVAGTVTLSSLTGAPSIANEKRMYKTVPTVTVAAPTNLLLATGEREVLKFTIAASSNEDVEVGKIEFTTSLSNASATANSVVVRSGGSDISLVAASSTFPAGGGEGVIWFTNPERITKGTSKTYELYLTFSAVGTGSASAVTQLKRDESSPVAPNSFDMVAPSSTISFVWSDRAISPHSVSTADWHNGYLVKTLPSASYSISKN